MKYLKWVVCAIPLLILYWIDLMEWVIFSDSSSESIYEFQSKSAKYIFNLLNWIEQ